MEKELEPLFDRGVLLLYYQGTLKSGYRKYGQMNSGALFLIKPLQIYTATRTPISDLLAT